MANQTVSIGNFETLLLSHQSSLVVGSNDMAVPGGDGGTDDNAKLVPVRSARLQVSHPEDRIPMGTDRDYMFGRPDIGLIITLRASSDQLGLFTDADNFAQKENLLIPRKKWVFTMKDRRDTPVTITATVSGYLRDADLDKPTDDQRAPLESVLFIRVSDNRVEMTTTETIKK